MDKTMADTQEFLAIALHELIYKTSAKKEKRSVSIGDAVEAKKTAKAILQHFQQEQERQVGLMRQWLNEDRITDHSKMVTNEELMVWLSKQKEGSK